jgi:hypothetical protein
MKEKADEIKTSVINVLFNVQLDIVEFQEQIHGIIHCDPGSVHVLNTDILT